MNNGRKLMSPECLDAIVSSALRMMEEIGIETSREDPEKQTVSRRIGRRGGFSKWLLCGALGLLFLETFLAWRFGHHPT